MNFCIWHKKFLLRFAATRTSGFDFEDVNDPGINNERSVSFNRKRIFKLDLNENREIRNFQHRTRKTV